MGQGIPPTSTIDVTRLTYSRSMYHFKRLQYDTVWSGLERNTSPTASLRVTNYANAAGYVKLKVGKFISKAQKIMDGQTDKEKYRANVKWS